MLWLRRVSNPRPLAREASVLPLSQKSGLRLGGLTLHRHVLKLKLNRVVVLLHKKIIAFFAYLFRFHHAPDNQTPDNRCRKECHNRIEIQSEKFPASNFESVTSIIDMFLNLFTLVLIIIRIVRCFNIPRHCFYVFMHAFEVTLCSYLIRYVMLKALRASYWRCSHPNPKL